MTIDEAIKKIERLDSVKIFDDEAEAIRLAVDALREKQEREKPCEYCEEARDLLFRQGACDSMCDHVYICGELLVCDYDTIEISYCPMCGRPLKGESNE